MSIVVVVKKSGKVVIAADRLAKNSDTKVTTTYRNINKIISFRDSFIGMTGPTAHRNVFQHLMGKYSNQISLNSEEEIFDTFLKLHPILKEDYFLNSDEDNENTYESSQIEALIANPSGIFGMGSWREAYEYEKFWALGSGFEYAMGAMFSVYEHFDNPEQIAEAGITAACEFSDSCGLPFNIYSVELTNNNE